MATPPPPATAFARPLFVGKRAAQDALGVSERTIERLLASGQLRSVQLGHRRLISVDELEAFASSLIGSSPALGVEDAS